MNDTTHADPYANIPDTVAWYEGCSEYMKLRTQQRVGLSSVDGPVILVRTVKGCTDGIIDPYLSDPATGAVMRFRLNRRVGLLE